MKRKVIKHLKGDIKGYKEEIKEDKELIKALKKEKRMTAVRKKGK